MVVTDQLNYREEEMYKDRGGKYYSEGHCTIIGRDCSYTPKGACHACNTRILYEQVVDLLKERDEKTLARFCTHEATEEY